MEFLKKNWGNMLFLVAMVALFVPQTGTPIRVFVQRLIATSPNEVEINNREKLLDYNWQLSNAEDKFENLQQSKNKVVLINMWATWCPPCLAEMPSLQKLYENFGDRVDFYFVSSEEKSVLQQFASKKGYTFPIFSESTTIPKILSTEALPTTYLISKTGEIVIKETGAADWNSEEIRNLLDKLLSE